MTHSGTQCCQPMSIFSQGFQLPASTVQPMPSWGHLLKNRVCRQTVESGLGRGVQRRFRQGVARSLGGAGAVKFGDSFRGHSHHLWVLDQTPLGLEAEVGREGA